MATKKNILIAGIGGASLGTEIVKCLALTAGQYRLFGCDISPRAYGHSMQEFEKTFLADPLNYIESLLLICNDAKIDCIIPGGEKPMVLLNKARDEFSDRGIILALNTKNVIAACSDKTKTFSVLEHLNIPVPKSCNIDQSNFKDLSRLQEVGLPCIVKPATGTGGSSMVFLANSIGEAEQYCRYIVNNGSTAVAQEYLAEDEGEFTIGVLGIPGTPVIGSIALRRVFDSKLSVLLKTASGIISSGYSQGFIGSFPDLELQAEKIATALQSEGPLNIQGRVVKGQLLPFEINPRFSASTYLRAMAGFNEIDLYLKAVLSNEEIVRPSKIREGYYLRSLTEVYVPDVKVAL